MNIVNVGYDSTNYYVLGKSDPRLLLDVGWPGTLPKLHAILKRKDIPFAEIRYLLVTHYHPDHAGLAQELKAEGMRLIVVEGQREGISKLKSYMKPKDGYVDIELQDNLELTLEESRSFLRSIGIAGTIIPTPGHSDDSVTLVLDSGDAFIGDLPSPGFVDESSSETVLQSWEKIQAHQAKMISPVMGQRAQYNLTLNPLKLLSRENTMCCRHASALPPLPRDAYTIIVAVALN